MMMRRMMAAARSIPAWAGETSERTDEMRMCEVYPRVGGGNAAISFTILKKAGLSPRGRGKLSQ